MAASLWQTHSLVCWRRLPWVETPSASQSFKNKDVQEVLTQAAFASQILLSTGSTTSSLQSSKTLLWKYLEGTMATREETNQDMRGHYREVKPEQEKRSTYLAVGRRPVCGTAPPGLVQPHWRCRTVFFSSLGKNQRLCGPFGSPLELGEGHPPEPEDPLQGAMARFCTVPE